MSEVTLKELREFLNSYLMAKKAASKLYSQAALARNIGIHQATLCRFLRGKRELKEANLKKVLAFCGKESVLKLVVGPEIICPRCLHHFWPGKK